MVGDNRWLLTSFGHQTTTSNLPRLRCDILQPNPRTLTCGAPPSETIDGAAHPSASPIQHNGVLPAAAYGCLPPLAAIDVAAFLCALLRYLRGPVIVLGERGRIHRGPAIEAVCQAHPRLQLEEFPAYAPELNPTEQVWNDFKGHTANSLLRDRRHRCRTLQANLRRVRRSQDKLRSFILPSPS